MAVENGENKSTENENNRGVPLWVWVIIIILSIICIYFLSVINSKKYQISSKNGYLIVKKGLFLPYGYSEYIPQDISKRETYAPLKIPEGESVSTIDVDGGELDIALFRIISGWIEKYLRDDKEENLKAAANYIDRLMKLNVSPDDYEKYSRLKGELIFRQAIFSFNMGIELIKGSREKIDMIKNVSPEISKKSEELLDKIDKINKVMNPEYSLIKREDIDKIREEIKKECISACVKETLERSNDNQHSQIQQDSSTPKSDQGIPKKDEN